jgi:hypothetical protein
LTVTAMAMLLVVAGTNAALADDTGRSGDDRAGDMRVDSVVDRPSDRPLVRPSDRPTDRPSDRPLVRPSDRPADRPLQCDRDRAPDRPRECRDTDREIDRPNLRRCYHWLVEHTDLRPVDNPRLLWKLCHRWWWNHTYAL